MHPRPLIPESTGGGLNQARIHVTRATRTLGTNRVMETQTQHLYTRMERVEKCKNCILCIPHNTIVARSRTVHCEISSGSLFLSLSPSRGFHEASLSFNDTVNSTL